jgi:glycosyltransferase involved in cell wall biosynthesis
VLVSGKGAFLAAWIVAGAAQICSTRARDRDLKPTLSLIIPALNEEANIAAAVQEVLQAVGDRFADYELLLFDDGSRDQTGAIMDKLAAGNPRIRVTHNATPRNLGGVYKQGVALARFDYVTWAPGDNENPAGALVPVYEAIGKADIVVPYPANARVRPLARRVISRCYTLLMNLLFGHWLPYYNGTAVFPASDLRRIEIRTNSFAYQSEILVKLLRLGKSCVTVAVNIQPRPGRSSKAFRWRNVATVVKSVVCLFGEVHFGRLRKSRFNETPANRQSTR